jgi:hypothetical protein
MTTTYDPTQVTLTIYGHRITGFGDGPITITPSTDLTSRTIGLQGEQALSINPDQSATISFSLHQNAHDNAVLAGLIQTFKRTKQWPTSPCKLDDSSSPVLPILRDCILSKRPGISRGKEQQDVVWELSVGHYEEVPQEQPGEGLVSAAVQVSNIYDSIKKLKDIFG